MSVIKEKKKTKPLGIKKILMKLLISAASGLVFAVIVVGVLLFFKPQLLELLEKTEDSTIIIESGSTSNSDTKNEDTESDKVTGEQDAGNIMSDVRVWYKQLYECGAQMSDALVKIGENGESDGIVFSTDGQSVIILAVNCPNGITARVEFCDGMHAEGTISGRDDSTGLGVIFVKKKDLVPITLEVIAQVEWGSAKTIGVGDATIAIGSPLGEPESVIVGTIIGANQSISYTDREHGLFATDIISEPEASGFLLDEKGALIGVVTQRSDSFDEIYRLKAYALSDITAVIELLANRKSIPYLGINGTTVTAAMKQQNKMPDGVYVDAVVEESPAMIGHIQAGDVLTGFDGQPVKNLKQLHQLLMEKTAGEKVVIVVHRPINGKYVEMTLELIVGSAKIESR